MSWEDRVRRAAYTSPSGSRIEWAWTSVSRETPKRTASFDAVGFNGTYVQENGHGGRAFPVRAIFSGPECDVEAGWFEEALLERGTGRLEHPLYGDFDVVPSGSISRKDDLVAEANVSIVEVTFLETTGAVFPLAQAHAPSDVGAAVAAMNAAAGAELGSALSLSTVATRASASAAVVYFADRVRGTLAPLVAGTTSVRRAYDDADTRLRQSMDVLIAEPSALVQALVELVELPAQAEASIASRVDAYEAFLAKLYASPQGRPQDALTAIAMPRRQAQIVNAFRLADVTAMAAVAACANAAVSASYRARPDAAFIAARLLELFDSVVAWRDEAYDQIAARETDLSGRVDTGGAHQALYHAVSAAAGYLLDLSFSLAPERRIVLDRPRTLLDLASELYGQVDEVLDLLIETNGLTGDEILEIPAGRSIVYYPA